MSETADLNDSTESLFTVFRGRLFQFRIVRGKKDCCLSCNRCKFLRHFMTVRFVINFRTLGNMFLSSIYVTEGEMGPF